MTFQTFTGREYLKIDIANNFGLDKKTWDERIEWFNTNEANLPELLNQAAEPALFYAGIQAWEKVKKGQPSGYPISLDATCSGIQILACLAGDRAASGLCNVIDTGKREDAYTGIYRAMVEKIGEEGKIDRKLTKQAIMTSFYSSTAVPKRVFGEGRLLDIFYDTLKERAPGAWEITETMLAIWDPETLENNWIMPDNFHVKIKVMGQVEEHVHFLNEPFKVTYKQNMPIKDGRSLGANMTHSIDGMLVREMARRCMYDQAHVSKLNRIMQFNHNRRGTGRAKDQMVETLWMHYQESGFLSARILDYLDEDNIGLVPMVILNALIGSLPSKPFEVVMVHDCFRVLPNYGNDLRRQYNNLLAELADSDMLSFLISQIMGKRIEVEKIDPRLSTDIRESNYALS